MIELLDNNTGDMQSVNCYCEEYKKIIKMLVDYADCFNSLTGKSIVNALKEPYKKIVKNILEVK